MLEMALAYAPLSDVSEIRIMAATNTNKTPAIHHGAEQAIECA